MSGQERMDRLCFVALIVFATAAVFAANATETQDKQEPAESLDQECELPIQAIDIPDAQLATEAEMLEAQSTVRYFDASVTAYTLCLSEAELRLSTRFPESLTALGTARAERNNAAVQLAEQVVNAFNSALEIFRNRGYQPAALRMPATMRDRAYCDPVNQRKTTVNADVKLSETGEVMDIEFPLGLGGDVQTILHCLIRKMTFDPAFRDGIPEPGIVALPVSIGGDNTQSARTGRTILATQLEPFAELDRACRLPRPPVEPQQFDIAGENEWRVIKSAASEFDSALAAYALCLADALLVETRPEHAPVLSDARIQRHVAAVIQGERFAESLQRAQSAYRSRALTPAIVKSQPMETVSAICNPKSAFGSTVLYYIVSPQNVVLRIAPKGEVVGISFPPGMSSALQKAVRCFVTRAKFDPATRDGMAVAAFLPISISASYAGMRIDPVPEFPLLVSPPEDIDFSFDRCVPSDLTEEGDVRLKLTVSRSGRVVGVQTAFSSGFERVDKVAACVARKLEYKPGRHFGREINMSGVALNLRIGPRNGGRSPSKFD